MQCNYFFSSPQNNDTKLFFLRNKMKHCLRINSPTFPKSYSGPQLYKCHPGPAKASLSFVFPALTCKLPILMASRWSYDFCHKLKEIPRNPAPQSFILSGYHRASFGRWQSFLSYHPRPGLGL